MNVQQLQQQQIQIHPQLVGQAKQMYLQQANYFKAQEEAARKYVQYLEQFKDDQVYQPNQLQNAANTQNQLLKPQGQQSQN